MAKPWYLSKTMWTNIISAGVMVLQSTELVTIVPPTWTEEFALAIFVLNLALRWVTTGSVTASSQSARLRNVGVT
jgi:hypothetical protein